MNQKVGTYYICSQVHSLLFHAHACTYIHMHIWAHLFIADTFILQICMYLIGISSINSETCISRYFEQGFEPSSEFNV
jgi:hypothetical protein